MMRPSLGKSELEPQFSPVRFRRNGERKSLSILYLCHRVPYPPDKGDKIRAYNQIRVLAERHRVHLLTLADGPVPDLAGLHELCEAVEVFPISREAGLLRAVAALPGKQPLTMAFFSSRPLTRRIAELTRDKRFDIVVAYSSATAPYAEQVSGVPRVLDMVDVDSAKWAQYACYAAPAKRPIYALEARRLQAYEASTTGSFAKVVLATGNETADFRAFAPGGAAVTIPNGIDLEYFRPLDLPKAKRPTLIFTGQMDYFANVDGVVHFAEEVLPRLRVRFPEIELLVVGRSPSRRVIQLSDLPGVHVTGAVGDVRPFLSRAWIFVAPLRIARGVQNKVLEAMASNLPVVCSERVLAGLSEGGFENGRDLLASGDDAGIEAAITRLLEDAGRRERMAAAARDRLADAYRWSINLRRFEDLLLAVAQEPSAAAGADLASLASISADDDSSGLAEGEARSA
jgi:sugar transferase (PEP-CTERM/EpsH1 system associated)